MNEVILTMSGITKLYPGHLALNNVDFDLRAGEVHVLVGENGAGKSTLGKVLLGFTPKTRGTIVFGGKEVDFPSTKHALENNIAAVYQELTLVPWLNVAQNIFLNREPCNRFGIVKRKKMEKDAAELLKELDCDYIDVTAKVKHLSVAEQQMVEIAKALSYHPRVIVFDEPTATLSEREVESLFRQIRQMKEKGIGIIYVSHRMEELRKIGDRFTVLRDGEKIATMNFSDVSDAEIIKMMVGRDIQQFYVRNVSAQEEKVLEVDHISGCAEKVRDVSLSVRKGEIVGLCGLVGSGRTETAQLVFGIKKPTDGEIRIRGEAVRIRSPLDAVKLGIGFVTEDRKRFGLALNDSIKWNILGVSLRKYCPSFFINRKTVERIAETQRERLRIATSSIENPCSSLSGGNQQKVVLAKWFAQDPQILIFDEPTRGIDIGAKKEIYNLMDELVAQGKSILMISSELPEVIGMSDRIYVMRNGSVVKEISRGSDEFNAERIGYYMLAGE